MRRPRLLDLFCCEGGASMGYHRAGFEVVGVDLFKHRDEAGKRVGFSRSRYPFPSAQRDALGVLTMLLSGAPIPFECDGDDLLYGLDELDVIAASPPCQAYSITKHSHHIEHPALIEPVRELLVRTGKPYVIENVEGAPLLSPLRLCGSEFNLSTMDDNGRRLRLQRHRRFESNVMLLGNGGCQHDRSVQVGGAYGGGSVDRARTSKVRKRGGYTPSRAARARLLGVDWMTQAGMSQAIPPIYTQFIGEQLLDAL